MDDSYADLIIDNVRLGKKWVHVYRDNPLFSKLYNAYPDYYEDGCDCMIFPYDVWQGIEVS